MQRPFLALCTVPVLRICYGHQALLLHHRRHLRRHVWARVQRAPPAAAFGQFDRHGVGLFATLCRHSQCRYEWHEYTVSGLQPIALPQRLIRLAPAPNCSTGLTTAPPIT
jgi:hypothetical protein